jgi:VNT family MFS transporter (synaptic vesicle glycoprotein 2)
MEEIELEGLGANGQDNSDSQSDLEATTARIPPSIVELDNLLDENGYGTFHIFLVLICGWVLASDSIEVTGVSYVIPVLDNCTNKDLPPDLYPTKLQSGALNAIIFVGIIFGSYFWGGLADIFGRKFILIISLTVNGAFGLASAFSPNFVAFMIFRFCSGFGVGGSVPVVFSYFSEFYSKRYTNVFIIALASFWTVGRLYASVFAWIVIPRSIDIGQYKNISWRVFLILCTVPCFTSALVLLVLPESPGFLFSKNKDEKALKVVRRIRKCQIPIIRSKNSEITIESSDEDENNDSDKTTLIKESDHNIQVNTTPSLKTKIIQKAKIIVSATVELFKPPYLRPNLVMIVVFFTLSFGYYGLTLWFPEYFKYIEYGLNDTCVASSNDSLKDNRIYLDSLYASAATVPGIVAGLLLIRVVGSKILLVTSMVLSALSTFAIWGVPKTSENVVILSCVFTGVSTTGWIALDVIVPELIPSHLRSTAFGLQSAIGRIGSIIGILIFGRLITVSPFLPILIVASLLTVGGISILAAPGQKDRKLPITLFIQYLIKKTRH